MQCRAVSAQLVANLLPYGWPSQTQVALGAKRCADVQDFDATVAQQQKLAEKLKSQQRATRQVQEQIAAMQRDLKSAIALVPTVQKLQAAQASAPAAAVTPPPQRSAVLPGSAQQVERLQAQLASLQQVRAADMQAQAEREARQSETMRMMWDRIRSLEASRGR
jgi:DNA repair exonuclease SbcCD ATPase subunit